jgi:membrane protease YdiL (CAAX protease family)
MLRWGAAAYALLSLGVVAGSWWWAERLPFTHPQPWLELSGPLQLIYSLLVGLALGGLLVISSRFSVNRFAWARRLHQEFRPVARQLSPLGVLTLASSSAIGEELLFRGLLQPELGLLLQALLFGLAHQMPGPSRWVWATWATVVGLLFGVVFQLTGSLLGAVVAHALVNGLNLSYLKQHDLAPKTALGGLLGRRPG